MCQNLNRISASAVCGAGIWLLLSAGDAWAQTELSLQETSLNITADHTGNVVVDIHLDSLGPNAAAYGVVGRSTEPLAGVPAGSAARKRPAPAIVRSAGPVDWNAAHTPDELIVCYDQNWLGGQRSPTLAPAMRRQKDDLHARMGAALAKELRLINADIIRLPQGVDLKDAAKRYERQPGVTYVQPNFVYSAIDLPDDPYFPYVPSSYGPPEDQYLWGLHTTAYDGSPIPADVVFDMDIDAAEAWEVTTGSNAVVVAVIDTGVDYTHADIAGNMWTNAGEIPGNGLDDDSNGYIDDYYGYDFHNNDGDPYDDHYHGTHVAGTIGAVGNNGSDVAGVNWNVRIMALKFLDYTGHGSTGNAIDCIDYAVQMGVTISNNSWGGPFYDAGLYAAIGNAGAAGHLFVAAAGNSSANTDESPSYPSAYDHNTILAVAALNKTSYLADFSNYGVVTVDIAAPGVGIYSLDVGSGIHPLNGTSMASPHVAGVAGLLKSIRPEATPLQIKQWILDGATPNPNLAGKVLTGGRLNAVEPLRLASMRWLRIGSREGIVDPSSTLTIPVTFVTDNTPVGFYSGSLVVLDLSYDDAVTRRIEIPVTMDLQFVEIPPVVEDVYRRVVRNFATPVNLVGYDRNLGQTITFTITTLPARGTLADGATPITSVPYGLASGVSTVTYTPEADELYTETFHYTAADGTTTSNIGTVTVEVAPPPPPPEEFAIYNGNTFVELSWLPAVDPELAGYNVYVSSTPGGPYTSLTPTPQADTTFRHYLPRYAVRYYVVTTALVIGGESDYSTELSGQATYVSRYAPQNLRATGSNQRVYLEWEAPWEYMGWYRVIRSLSDGSNMEIVAEITTGDTSYIDEQISIWYPGPENGVTYNYYIENYDYWESWGSSSNIATATPDDSTPPGVPTGLHTIGGTTFVDVRWNANPELDIDEYWVLRSDSLAGPFEFQGVVPDRRFYDTNVQPLSAYYYMIAAVDLDGEESDYTTPVAGSTGADVTPPGAPTGLAATAGDGFVALDWNDNGEPDLATYVIYRGMVAGGPYSELDSAVASTYTDSSVVNGTSYYYVVTARDESNNESGYSNEASVTPHVDACSSNAQCDDGVYCNGAEVCVAGWCAPGTPPDCADGVACTTDSCNEATDSCDHVPNDTACDDGLFCNGTETCHATLGCQAGTAPACADSVACTTDSCNEATDSCDHAPNDAACSDGLFCNGAETCHVTLGCQAGTAPNCADSVPCTTDSCNEATDNCDHAPNDAACNDGLFCNGAETCHVTLGCQGGSDPCDGAACDEDTDTCDTGPALWISFNAATSVPGVGTVADEDIVAYEAGADTWSLVFDGSDVGLGGFVIDGFAVLPSGDVLLSFTAAGSVAGMTGGPSGTTLDDSDIVRFIPTSLGPNTAGSFVFYFDGSDVGLTTDNEDVDAIAVAPDGRLVLSTLGACTATGASSDDEDLIIFTATSLGSVTAGSFAMYFDGSDVGLTATAEDVDAAAITTTGEFLLSTEGNFNVSGASGADEDILEFTPSSLGANTSGTYLMYLDLSTLGISSTANVGGVELVE